MSTGEDYTIDKYKLVNCLASGHNSQVWEVTDGARRVAMKLLLPEALKDVEQKSTLKHESKAGKTFDHPNIIKYHELVINKHHAYFIMDLFNAPNIKAQVFNDLHSVHLRFKKVVELTCQALEHVHSKGWLHRDMKPDNVLSNKSSEVRLIDFSLAAKQAGALGALFTTKKKTTAGTRTYMAPEQILQKRLTPATDMYSLGIMIFEMLTGSPPFKGSNPKDLLVRHINETAPPPSDFNKNVTPEMDRLVAKLLAKKPENRFKTVTDLLLDFRRINVFKEPIPDKIATMTAEQEAEEANKDLDKRLDSRADAKRTSVLGTKTSTSVSVPAAVPAKPAAPVAAAAKPQAAAPAPPKPAPPVPQRAPVAGAPVAGAPPRPAAPMPPQPGMPMPQRPGVPVPMPPRPAGGAPLPPQPYPQPGAPRPGAPMPPQPAARAPVAPPPQARPPQPTANVPPPQRPPAPGPAPARPPVPASAPPQPAAARPPQPAAARPPQPAAARPPQPAAAPRPPAPAAKPQVAPKPQTPPKPDEGMKIDDLPSFDELPPII